MPNVPKDGEILTAQEAADYLAISVRTLRRMTKAGVVPGQKIGGEWRFSRSGLLAWLSHRTYIPAALPASSVEEHH